MINCKCERINWKLTCSERFIGVHQIWIKQVYYYYDLIRSTSMTVVPLKELAQLPVVAKDLLGEARGCTWSWGRRVYSFGRRNCQPSLWPWSSAISSSISFSPLDAPCLNFFPFNWNEMIHLAFSSIEVYQLVDDIGHTPLLSMDGEPWLTTLRFLLGHRCSETRTVEGPQLFLSMLSFCLKKFCLFQGMVMNLWTLILWTFGSLDSQHQ